MALLASKRFKFTYGPVPSRRLGRSLGVSIIPHKVCSYSCVYCQLGRTRAPRIKPYSYFDRGKVIAEIEERVLETSPDCITFVGDGEPTLSADLGWYIGECKARWNIPVAVITNGSLLFMKEVGQRLLKADMLLPSLDAGDISTFQAINRPHPELELQKIIEGMIAFRREYKGLFRLEVMFVKDINDSELSLRNIRKLVWAIRPDRVDIAIPTRPPAESWVRPPDPDRILYAQRLLRAAQVMTWPEEGAFDFAGFDTLFDAVIALASRHPLRWNQAKHLEEAFGQHAELERLVRLEKLSTVKYGESQFIIPPAEESDGD